MDWTLIAAFYRELLQDVYEQPDEDGRIRISQEIINSAPIGKPESVLDVGCGYGYAENLFPNTEYFGITLSAVECEKARGAGKNVFFMDYNSIRLSREFDLIFSSHSLEHSPFPLLTLMEWHRVGKNLLLITPNPKHYGFIGKNHYFVAEPPQIRWWLRRAGWRVTWNKETDTDLAFFATRELRLGTEGWAELDHITYVADRDNKTIEEVSKEEERR